MQPARQLEQHLFQPPLHRTRQRRVRDRELLARPQPRGEVRQRERLDAEATDAVGVDQTSQILEEGGLPVGSHRHHLVLVRRAPEAEVGRQLLVQQPERVRELLARQHVQLAAAGSAGEVRRRLAAAVQHQHAARVPPRGEGRRARVGDVVGDEPELAVPTTERGREEARRPLRVQRPQALPLVGGDVRARLSGQRRVVRVRDGFEIASRDPCLLQAEGDRLLGQFPGRERDRSLAVLAPREALLLGGGDDLTVHHEGGGRVVEDGVDAENAGHGPAPSPRSASSETARVRCLT